MLENGYREETSLDYSYLFLILDHKTIELMDHKMNQEKNALENYR